LLQKEFGLQSEESLLNLRCHRITMVLIKQLLLQLQVLNPRIAIVTKGADYRALVELLGGQYREISLRTNLVKNAWDLQQNSEEPGSAQIAGVASLAYGCRESDLGSTAHSW